MLHSWEVIPPNNKIPGVPEAPTPKAANDNNTNPVQDIGPNGPPTSGVGVTNSSTRDHRVALQVVLVKGSAPYVNRVIETYAP